MGPTPCRLCRQPLLPLVLRLAHSNGMARHRYRQGLLCLLQHGSGQRGQVVRPASTGWRDVVPPILQQQQV